MGDEIESFTGYSKDELEVVKSLEFWITEYFRAGGNLPSLKAGDRNRHPYLAQLHTRLGGTGSKQGKNEN